jgi:hypothetical protein
VTKLYFIYNKYIFIKQQYYQHSKRNCTIGLTIQKVCAKIYAVKREYLTGSEKKRNEPSGSFQLERDWRVTTAKSVADKEPKEPLVSN